jgi:hypothetical protein
VSKMILESAQMLSTVLGGPYKPTHANHPCTKWIGHSRANAVWLIDLARELNNEWRNRYGHSHDHKSWSVIETMTPALGGLPARRRTPFALAMPDEYKSDDPVASYRAYYKSKSFARWDHGNVPRWW